jgi:hypothetical protein
MKTEMKTTGSCKFELGLIAVRRSVMSVSSKSEVAGFLERHTAGDWGLIGPVGQRLNDRALINGEKIFSVFESESRDLLLIVTDGDRDTTYVALRDDPIWEEMLDDNRPSKATH